VKALPTALRLKILEELTREPSSLLVGAKVGVSASVVRKLRAKMVQTGSFEPGTASGRARLVHADTEQRLLQIVRESPDATLNVLREVLADETGVAVSETTMWRQLNRMGITLKKRQSEPRSKTGRT
jgi:transposase